MREILSRLMWTLLSFVLVLTFGCGGGGGSNPQAATAAVNSWIVTQSGTILSMAYGTGSNFPQYAALDLSSGYLRLVYSQSAVWGTSTIIVPALWSGGIYYQGAPITATWKTDGTDLIISFAGTISTLAFQGTARISPPANNSILAVVSMTTSGSVAIDSSPNEAFKPVMLSSMNISSNTWDAQSAYAGTQTYSLPASGWIISPAVNGVEFGLNGGTSTWKTNAPTVDILLAQSLPITGWITNSSNPN